uniref:reverse transcriptase domain-containing protein n=1 Tax=Klebsiella pneumoniae TaxID=573 RepID=UPI00117B3F1B
QGIPKVEWLLEDIIVCGESVEEHLKLLEQVLGRLKRANIRMHKDKCKWFQSSVKYLGHQLDREGIRPTEEHVEAI